MFTLITTRAVLARGVRAQATIIPKRTLLTLKDHKVVSAAYRILAIVELRGIGDWQYTAHATARGQGRNGQVKSDDDHGLDLRLAMPKSLGGKGDGQNPEMLFAMGYAGACTYTEAIQICY